MIFCQITNELVGNKSNSLIIGIYSTSCAREHVLMSPSYLYIYIYKYIYVCMCMCRERVCLCTSVPVSVLFFSSATSAYMCNSSLISTGRPPEIITGCTASTNCWQFSQALLWYFIVNPQRRHVMLLRIILTYDDLHEQVQISGFITSQN